MFPDTGGCTSPAPGAAEGASNPSSGEASGSEPGRGLWHSELGSAWGHIKGTLSRGYPGI